MIKSEKEWCVSRRRLHEEKCRYGIELSVKITCDVEENKTLSVKITCDVEENKTCLKRGVCGHCEGYLSGGGVERRGVERSD